MTPHFQRISSKKYEMILAEKAKKEIQGFFNASFTISFFEVGNKKFDIQVVDNIFFQYLSSFSENFGPNFNKYQHFLKFHIEFYLFKNKSTKILNFSQSDASNWALYLID